jgi:hypothetical protein
VTIVRIVLADPRTGGPPDGGSVNGQHLVVLADTAAAEDGGHRAVPLWLPGLDFKLLWGLLNRPASDAVKGVVLEDTAARLLHAAAVASVSPSGLTLTGLVQHMAEVERNWFRRVLAGEQAPPIYDPQADPSGPDGGFDLAEGATLGGALETWRAEIARAREQCAGRALNDTGRFMDQDVNLRWIYVHMIEEYARHNGHADLLRERIDGATGA